MGPSLEHWIARPWVFTLWTYRHIQEKDYRAQWAARASQQASAELTAVAFHEPRRLEQERRTILEAARRLPTSGAERSAHIQALLRGHQMAGEIERGNVLSDVVRRHG